MFGCANRFISSSRKKLTVLTHPHLGRWRSKFLAAAATLALAFGLMIALPGTSHATGTLPCDIYGAAGTPCVSADSTVRALYSAYNGNLYQVQRASDGATTNIGVLAAGGYANAAAQDSFCANTTCIITIIYDQSPQHNNLTIEPAGAAGGQNVGANAAALPVEVGGHAVYGVNVTQGVGYRDDSTTGVATNGQAEGMYIVTGGKVDNGTGSSDDCCFDYGNVENTETDTGAGHMDAINFSTLSPGCSRPCAPTIPSVAADMENGIFGGMGTGDGNLGNNSTFVTALLKNNGSTGYALKSANAQSGSLTTWLNGPLPTGYTMHQEGGIVLGTGGDDSNRGVGTFFEGVMTSGYPTDAADNSVQSNIVAAQYLGDNSGTVTFPSGKCMDVAGNDTGGDGSIVDISDCVYSSADQHWYHNANGTLTTMGKCLDIDGNGTANGTLLELWDCNGVGGQVWIQQSNGSLLNPQSGRCIDDPSDNTTNGTQLQIWDCNGVTQQKLSVNAGGPITVPSGKCMDVAGDDTGGDGSHVQLWDCQSYAADQHWYLNSNGSLTTLGKCLDIDGNGTANGTLLELWDCNGVGGQVWVPQSNGSLLNPQSGRCIDDPSDNTTNGTQLQIWDCNGTVQQRYALH
jgi:hypothetical protein